MLTRPLLLLALFARSMNAQATITGLVHDSISHTPLAGAEVQLVPADNPALLGHTATSDSLGRFTLTNVPKGRYALGFLHPMLDSLGVDVPPKVVFVDNDRSIRADLAIPSGGRLRAAICGPQSTPDSVGVVVGVVRDARSLTPVAGAAV
nr:carboxypeptidase regulatory-like domain-containing protein [Gemmatimonadaceae bacterium]